jgi:hypothetical protein
MSLAVDPAIARTARCLLEAAGRRLAQLESPSGFAATKYGALLRREALDRMREAIRLLTEEDR